MGLLRVDDLVQVSQQKDIWPEGTEPRKYGRVTNVIYRDSKHFQGWLYEIRTQGNGVIEFRPMYVKLANPPAPPPSE